MSFTSSGSEAELCHEARAGHRLDISFAVSGTAAPFMIFRLASGQGLVCDTSSIILHEEAIELRNWPGAGERLRLAVNAGQSAGARIIASTGGAGRLGTFELDRIGGRLLCPADAFLAAGPGVGVTFYARYRGNGDSGQRGGITFLMLQGHGWAFLKAAGDVLEERLKPGKTLCVEATAIAAMTAAVDFDPVKGPSPLSLARVKGPGRVWLQSAGLRLVAGEVSTVAAKGKAPDAQPPRPVARTLSGEAVSRQ